MNNLSALPWDRAAVKRRSVSLSYLSACQRTAPDQWRWSSYAACRIKGDDTLLAVSPACVGLHSITDRRQFRHK